MLAIIMGVVFIFIGIVSFLTLSIPVSLGAFASAGILISLGIIQLNTSRLVKATESMQNNVEKLVQTNEHLCFRCQDIIRLLGETPPDNAEEATAEHQDGTEKFS